MLWRKLTHFRRKRQPLLAQITPGLMIEMIGDRALCVRARHLIDSLSRDEIFETHNICKNIFASQKLTLLLLLLAINGR